MDFRIEDEKSPVGKRGGAVMLSRHGPEPRTRFYGELGHQVAAITMRDKCRPKRPNPALSPITLGICAPSHSDPKPTCSSPRFKCK
jgi:hypothetical protein